MRSEYEWPITRRFDEDLHLGVRVSMRDEFGNTICGTITKRGAAHMVVTFDDGQEIGYSQEQTEHFAVLRPTLKR